MLEMEAQKGEIACF